MTLADVRAAAWGMIFAAIVVPTGELLAFGAASDGAFASAMRAVWGRGPDNVEHKHIVYSYVPMPVIIIF